MELTDSGKFFWVKACASDESAIDIGLFHDVNDICGLH
jgi:hypothetical protein